MKPEKRTVAVCRTCWEYGEGFYMPADEAGSKCPMEHDLNWGQPPRKLIKRVLYICTLENHCDEVGFPSRADAVEHMAETKGGEG